MADSSLVSGFRTGFGSAFLQFALERFASLGSLAWGEIGVVWDVEDELRKFQRTFFKIQDLVDHANTNPLSFYGGSNAWVHLFEDMRKLAYDAESLLDHVSLHLSIYCAQHWITSNQEKQVRAMVLSSFRELNLPRKISTMQNNLEGLAKEMENLVAIEKIKSDARIACGSWSQFTSLHSNTSPGIMVGRSMVGRANDKKLIVRFLSESCQSSNFSVFSIMGMSGIGKTTVARKVYDDSRMYADGGIFHLKVWVFVSAHFDAIRITKSIIEYVTGDTCTLSDLDSLQHMLQVELRGKKVLLVLDDYWSENCDDWSILTWPFRSCSKGSKVIVTTRNRKVASIVCSSKAYELEILSDDDCWELIKQSANLSDELTQNLESVGKQIAQKCKGVPLVATTLGNMLRCKSSEEEWCSALKFELWDMLQDSSIFLRLMQCYLNLPAHLQKCFGYCSIFPQNHEFEIEELIFLWVAEGFIQPKGAHTSEDLAKGYFNDLCSKFFFEQDINASNQVRYKMHNLIHGMSRLVSKDICSHLKHDMLNSSPLFGNSCHLSLLHDSTQPLELRALVKNERLRTFLLMSNGVTTELDPQLFSHLKFLRVLGLGRTGLTALVDSIDQLIYLRYLNLSENPISCLPKSICKLIALHILKLRSCPNLRVLPEEMNSLVNLQHLYLEKRTVARMPPQFGKLSYLQHLSVYVVNRKSGCGIGELKSLNYLSGSLCIRNIDISNASEAREAMLNLKTCLDKLELEWRSISHLIPQLFIEKTREQAAVLANLQPHTNLKDLVIRNYCGMVYPAWLSDSSYHFTSIHLEGLKYCDHLPSLGELPCLTFFAISDMPCLELIDHNFYGTNNAVKFSSLKSFEIKGMSNLRRWEYGSGTYVSPIAMPCLRTFTLHDCPLLSSLPQNLQSLLPISNVSDCPNLHP